MLDVLVVLDGEELVAVVLFVLVVPSGKKFPFTCSMVSRRSGGLPKQTSRNQMSTLATQSNNHPHLTT